MATTTNTTENKRAVNINKGELSELYAVVNILSEGSIDVVDGDLNCINQRLRFDRLTPLCFNSPIFFEIDHQRGNVVIDHQGQKTVIRQRDLLENSQNLLQLIRKSKRIIRRDAEEILSVRNLLKLSSIKAAAQSPYDFIATVALQNIYGQHTLGFSIKSQLGAASTLLNANNLNSAIRYRVVRTDGRPLTAEEKRKFLARNENRSHGYIRANVAHVYASGCELAFDSYRGEALRYNLALVDAVAPELMALLVLQSYKSSGSQLMPQILDGLCKSNALRRNPSLSNLAEDELDRHEMLRYKLKNVLSSFASGVTVTSKWNGQNNIAGGMLVVTDTGKVVSLQLFTGDALKQYLYSHTRFEGPSSSRHSYGKFYEHDGELCFDLQLQVRFDH